LCFNISKLISLRNEIKRERDKSRELRRSRWWKNRIAQGRCHWCGGSFTAEELTMDHIVPVTRGGKASRNNVVPSCPGM